MSTPGVPVWLSKLPPQRSCNLSSPRSPTPPTPSPASSQIILGRKRKYSPEDQENLGLVPPQRYRRQELRPLTSLNPVAASAKRQRLIHAKEGKDETKRATSFRPLTRQALKELTRNMGRGPAANPKTPRKQTPSSSSASKSTTRTLSTSDTHSRQTANSKTVRAALTKHGMHFRCEEAWDRQPLLREKIERHFTRERSTAMKEASAQKIRKYVQEHALDGEDTFHTGGIQEAVLKIAEEHHGWQADGLTEGKKCNFVRGFVPGSGDDENKLGISNPCPDHVYGLRAERWPDPNKILSDQADAIVGVSNDPNVLHAFFVIEDKGCDGTIAESQNQAIRDGAAMVNAKLRLLEHARNLELRRDGVAPTWQHPPGVNVDAIAFSCCWLPAWAEVYVHWFEKPPTGEKGIFHANQMGRYDLERRTDLTEFRHDLHNIFDWGVLQHKTTAQAYVDYIVKLERQVHEMEKKADGIC